MSVMLRPRALVHRGHVEARGLLIDDRTIGAEEARRRVLALWSPRATVFHIDEGYLLLLPEPLTVRADAALGGPLVLQNHRFVSAPLEEDELAQLPELEGAIVLVRGGRALIAELDESNRVDPAAWLDVSSYELMAAETLGELPPKVEVVAVADELDLRKELRGKIPEADLEAIRELQEILKSMPAGGGARESQPSLGARILASLARFAARILSFGTGKEAADPVQTTRQRTALVEVDAPVVENPGFFLRLRRRLQELAAHLTRINTFGRLIGRQHANYIARMMEMFERGELADALRHAIPLSDHKNPTDSKPILRMPSPRSDLRISASSTGRTSAIYLDDDLFGDLRRMYRRAFERLEREGRIEEAAFVLAELLQSSEEAVAFLEKHGRLELAAKLADSRGLAPGLIVRQYFLAGFVERAIQVARRTGAFADAIARLTRTNQQKAAEALRVLWARTLAASGDYGAAVETLWPVLDQRHLAAPWVEAAISAGGPLAARMLVRSLSLLPDSFEKVREAATLFLTNESFEGLATRTAFARALVSEGMTPETRILARPTVRSMVRDEASWNMSIEPGELRALVSLAADGALRTDLPTRPPEKALARLKMLEHPRYFRFREDDGGAVRVADAALLPSGRLLVALGELGVRYLTPDGRTIAHFDQPAEKLVLSDYGDRAITVASRGEIKHIGRIDLAHRRATAWCDLAISAYADTFDGSVWYAGERSRHGGKDTLLALDATSVKQEALWRLGDVLLEKVARSKFRLSSAIAVESGELEIWTHELPSMTLRGRIPFRAAAIDALLADGTGGALIREEALFLVGNGAAKRSFQLALGEKSLLAMDLSTEFAALALRDKDGATVLLIDPQTGKEHARIELGGARACSLRLAENTLVTSDDRGRVIILDHRYGRILRILRLS